MKASELIAILERHPDWEVTAWDPIHSSPLDEIYRVVKAEGDKFAERGPWVWVLDIDTAPDSNERFGTYLDGEGELE